MFSSPRITIISDIDKTLLYHNENYCASGPLGETLANILKDPCFSQQALIGCTGQTHEEFSYNMDKYSLQKILLPDGVHILEDGAVLYTNGKLSLAQNLDQKKYEKIGISLQDLCLAVSQEVVYLYQCLGMDIGAGWSQLDEYADIICQAPQAVVPTLFIKGSEAILMEKFGPDVFEDICRHLNTKIPGSSFAFASNETLKHQEGTITKGTGVSRLFSEQYIPEPVSLFGFGDGVNDIPLAKEIISRGGIFVAVGNADEKLKDESTIVLPQEEIAAKGVVSYLAEMLKKR